MPPTSSPLILLPDGCKLLATLLLQAADVALAD